MKITIAQLDPMVGDIAGNLARMVEICARAEGSDLVVFTELALVGYPPRDLLERRWFIERCDRAVEQFARASADWPGTGTLFGAPTRTGERIGRGLHNSAILVEGGRTIAIAHKSL
ncbi:MAG TPA: nitrilase-related carbon-nitrogen hydrolase, partial [Armatimonadota bacterium]|nr:nitrilase-related carbon-nitrogen hydrolase [Armatimonadota bacterium]